MTIDEALALAESDQYSSDPVVGALTAEVARLRAENAELIVKNEQLYKDRYDALSVHTKEGMLASEWLLRTGKAERRVKELEAENAELRTVVEAWEYTAKVAGMNEPPPEAAELDWFRRLEQQIKAQADARHLGAQLIAGYLAEYERANPKPGTTP